MDIFDELYERYPSLKACGQDISAAYELLCAAYDRGGKLLLCGNGGSAADCDHIVGELMKGFLSRRPLSEHEKALFDDRDVADSLQGGLPAVSLCAHSALMTAYSNDVDPDMIFAQQVWALAIEGRDVLIALSTSGNSRNVVAAVKTAIALGVPSIGITGSDGGALKELATVCICLPEVETFKVQELTLPLYHALCAALEKRYFS